MPPQAIGDGASDRARRIKPSSDLLGQDPVSQVFDVSDIFGLDDLVFFFVAVRKLGLLAGGQVLDDAVLRVSFALEFDGRLLEGRAILFLVDGVALETIVLPSQRLGHIGVHGLRGL